MDQYLHKLRVKQDLSRDEAKACFLRLFESEVEDSQIAELLTLLRDKELLACELQGFLDYLSANCSPCNLTFDSMFDVCGTGGDGKNTINISTLTAFILAAMGEKVAKHGNYSASSSIGSSNLLEALGVPLVNNELQAQESISKAGIVFLHAPLWHPKLKRVAPIRKALGFRTVFNLLGPLLNPALPKYQLIGTPTLNNALLLKDVQAARLEGTNRKFAVICDHNGYDEVSLTAEAKVLTAELEKQILPADFGVRDINPESLKLPASLDETVILSKRLLSGLGQKAHEQVVAANCALALQIKYPEKSLATLFNQAIETIQSGKAMQVLNTLRGQS